MSLDVHTLWLRSQVAFQTVDISGLALQTNVKLCMLVADLVGNQLNKCQILRHAVKGVSGQVTCTAQQILTARVKDLTQLE